MLAVLPIVTIARFAEVHLNFNLRGGWFISVELEF